MVPPYPCVSVSSTCPITLLGVIKIPPPMDSYKKVL